MALAILVSTLQVMLDLRHHESWSFNTSLYLRPHDVPTLQAKLDLRHQESCYLTLHVPEASLVCGTYLAPEVSSLFVLTLQVKLDLMHHESWYLTLKVKMDLRSSDITSLGTSPYM